MPNLQELKKQREEAIDAAESFVSAAERGKRPMTDVELTQYNSQIATVQRLNSQIKQYEDKNTLRSQLRNGMLIPGRPAAAIGSRKTPVPALSEDYHAAFFNWLGSGGNKMDAALYEGGGGPSGGYVVPSMVDGLVVPLAPPDMGVREVAKVIPTEMDIKIPQATAISTAAWKAEGTGSGANLFAESEPTLGQFTLSAFMVGLNHQASWELLQDASTFQQFILDDLLLAVSILEDSAFITGSGSGQPQGLLGNVGAGVTGETADSNGNLLSVAATFDVLGTLKTPYHRNASWLMQRATAVELRKAQTQANLFEPVFNRVGTQDYLHGYPVTYSAAMPAIAAGATPVLFGDFNQGYIIGDRGGSGIRIKILDQPKALEGIVVFLAFRRVDGRVRRSEAIQGITLHT